MYILAPQLSILKKFKIITRSQKMKLGIKLRYIFSRTKIQGTRKVWHTCGHLSKLTVTINRAFEKIALSYVCLWNSDNFNLLFKQEYSKVEKMLLAMTEDEVRVTRTHVFFKVCNPHVLTRPEYVCLHTSCPQQPHPTSFLHRLK